MRKLLAILLLATALGPACKSKSKDNTKIMVAVWSDLTVPSEINSVRFDVTGPSESWARSFDLTAGTQLPVQFQLEPAGAKNATFTVKATALLGTAEVLSQSARVSFVPGQALLLKLFLGRVCQGKMCSTDLTCSAGVCVQIVPILVPYDSGKPLAPPDAGAAKDSSGSADDGGVADGGVGDGGTKDVRAADARLADTADNTSDAPMGSGRTGGNDGTGGTGGATIAGGSTGTVILSSGIDARPADVIATGGIDAPVGGAVGGSSASGGKGGTVATGGVAGSGGVASGGTTAIVGGASSGGSTASGGATASSSGGSAGAGTTASGGASSSGGVTASGGSSIASGGATSSSGGTTATGGSTIERCVFGTSKFGSCTFGP